MMAVEKLDLLYTEKGMELPLEKENWVMKRGFGYSPVQSLAAAVGACGGYVYDSILTNSKIPHEFKEVKVTYETNDEVKPHPISKIRLAFRVIVEKDYQERAEHGVKLVSKHCPVIQSLDPKIEVEEVVVFD